jgi:hypothetical protein
VIDRVLVILAAPVVLVALWATAWLAMPGVRHCVSIFCGANFDPGGVDLFGSQLFTPAQTVLMAIGIWASAFLLARGVLPARTAWTSVGFGLLVLAFVIAFTLPSPAVGPAPSRPCSTPGADGPVAGRCMTGPPPVDSRVPDRALVAAAGLLAVVSGSVADRRRRGN